MKAFLTTAFHRPQDQQLVLENFYRQIYPNKYLVIINNGPALNTQWKNLPPNIFVLQSQPHQTHARNAALDFIDINFRCPKMFAVMDSDDFYGSGYLSECVWYVDQYPKHIIGKSVHWIKTDTLGTFLYKHPFYKQIHGATLCTDDFTKRFTDLHPFGEDHVYVHTFDESLRISSSMHNYVYIRKDYGRAHTFTGSDYIIQDQNLIPKHISDFYKSKGNQLIGPYENL